MNRIVISIIIIVVVFVIGYLLGVYLPYFNLATLVSVEEIMTQAQYNSIFIRAVAAIATFLAVIVALFKEDIRRIWDNVNLSIELNSDKIEEVLESMKIGKVGDTSPPILKAEYYYSQIVIVNNGTKPAKEAQLYVEKIIFTNPSGSNREIEVVGRPSLWEYESEVKTMIPPSGRKKCNIITINAPQKISKPDGEALDEGVLLRIGETLLKQDFHKGKIEIQLAVYSESCRAKKFVLNLSWDGKWHNRLSEMSRSLTVELKHDRSKIYDFFMD